MSHSLHRPGLESAGKTGPGRRGGGFNFRPYGTALPLLPRTPLRGEDVTDLRLCPVQRSRRMYSTRWVAKNEQLPNTAGWFPLPLS